MVKTVFVLLTLILSGTGQNDWTVIDKFDSRQECQAFAEEIKKTYKWTKTLCYEKHEKKTKLKCTIKNNYSFKSSVDGHFNSAMNSYPYPESFSCVEE